MKVIRAHKIRLNPTEEQAAFFRRCAGVARFVYNHGLAEWKRLYDEGEKPTALLLKTRFNGYKREAFPFVLEVPKDVAEGAFAKLGQAFKNFFAGVKGERPRMGYPRFKSKKRSKSSFRLNNDKFRVDGHWLKVPRLATLVNMAEALRFAGRILSGVVSEQGGQWFISITVELEAASQRQRDASTVAVVGIDLGVKRLATLSDGTHVENQNVLRSTLNKLKRLNRELARRQLGSNRWWKTKRKLQRLHARIRNQRLDFIHKMTTRIVRTYRLIGVEDLHVAGMVSNRRLALSIADVAMGEILRQLQYKAAWFGGTVQQVGRFFPSSKLCSSCGALNPHLTLQDRQWHCPACGTAHERDFNAAMNIKREALRLASL